MTRWLLAPALAAGLLAVQGVPAGGGQLSGGPPDDRGGVERRVPRKIEGGGNFAGTVTDLTPAGFTVVAHGQYIYDAWHELVEVRIKPGTVKRFVVSPNLARGGYGRDAGEDYPEEYARTYGPVGSALPWESYRNVFEDLRAGDIVDVLWCRVGGADVCTAFEIRRRPGGHVPPVRGERLDMRYPGPPPRYHERVNAWADWEERGIPIPYHLHPGGNEASVAPMPHDKARPREVAPGVPAIPAAKD